MPLWSWANVVSLDAVAVGLLWQLLYTTQFCQRFPAVYELAIIGLSIWLVYTADRLFDAIRLDRTRPHTFRHRFHAAHQTQLTTIWFVALAVDTLLIVRFAHESQLRWGCSAIAIVVAYVTGIHLIRNASSWFPKELQAGMLFAFGVSLPAWSEISANGFVALLASVLMTGFLFTGNCFAIAHWEQDLDSSQGFDSWFTRHPAAGVWLPWALIFQVTLAFALAFVGVIAPLIAACLIFGNVLLFGLVVASRGKVRQSDRRSDSDVLVRMLVVLADVALVIPPVAFVAAGAMS